MTIHFSHIPATFKHIRRVANTSFKLWVKYNIPQAEILFAEGSPVAGLRHMTPEEITSRWSNPGTTFGFVRNPFDRIVSGFHWMGQQAEMRMRERYHMPDKEQPVPIDLDIAILMSYKKGFDHWVKNIPAYNEPINPYGTPALFIIPHKQTQLFCFDYDVPQIVIKVEQLDEDFRILQDLLQCNAPMLHVNQSERGAYKQYYTDETRKIVQRWVEEDLDAFKYTFTEQ